MDNKDVGLEVNGWDVDVGIEFDGTDVDVGAITCGDVWLEIEIGDKGMGIGLGPCDGMCVGVGVGDGDVYLWHSISMNGVCIWVM